MKNSIIAGGAGFVGSNLVKLLINDGGYIFIFDNLSRGRIDYISSLLKPSNKKIFFLDVDLSDLNLTTKAFEFASSHCSIDEVWHFAANSDIASGISNPSIDLKDTFMTTFSLINSMKIFNISTIHFSSSSAIYGNLGSKVLHESIGPLLPISNYGAMKLSSEAIISAATESFLSRANIFRFPNVVGLPATHGVILDFINKLHNNQNSLEVLGNGSQKKCYLHISDLINAMIHVRNYKDNNKLFLCNVGPLDSGVTVKYIAESVVKKINPLASINYGKENRGWIGDVPSFNYSIDNILKLGWKPRYSSKEAINLTINEIIRSYKW